MPVNVRFQIFFGSDDGWGWSEMHHKTVSVVPGDLLPLLQAFKIIVDDKRRPLLGRDRFIKGLRVSYPTATGGVASSAFRYAPVLYPGNQREGCSPHVAAKVRMGESTNTHFSDIYLRGFWDVVEQDEELNFTTAGGSAWKTLLDQYIAALVAGEYGWLGTNEALTRRGKVVNYTTDLSGFVNFTIQITSGPALPAIGTVLPMRIARLNNSNSVLNRTHIVKVIDATNVETVVKTAAGLFISDGTFVMTSTDFYRYTGAQYTVLAKRACGAPFFQSPGRAKDRARS